MSEFISSWNERKQKKVVFITNDECGTFSSVLWDIYAKKLIKDDFILIDSHTVTEVDFT